jgi:hypothetical protein
MSTIKFGGKPTMRDKMDVAKSRVGKNPGVSKGSKPSPKPKVKPILKKGTVGAKVTYKF